MAKKDNASTNENQQKQNFPLFFKEPRPVDAERHAKAGIKRSVGFQFAEQTNSLPLNGIEFVEAAKHYPIVFTQDEQALPAVIVGLEQTNYYVDEKGQWRTGAYIPAYVRKYPFTFMEITGKDQFVLCLDEGSEHFVKKSGAGAVALYAEEEKPSDLTKQALEFCGAFQSQYITTQAFTKDLKEAGLLVPNQSEVKLFNGRVIRLGGFQMIDEQKFNALPEETFKKFREKGWLPWVYFALMSATNWKRLADAAAKHEPAKAA